MTACLGFGADNYISVSFRNPAEAAPVDLFVVYYHRQAEGSGIHSPEVCLPSGGWEVSDWQRTVLPVQPRDAGGGGMSLPANRAIIRKGTSRQLVLYWFEQRGRQMTSANAAKAVTVWDALTQGRTDGALVRVVMPLSLGESPAEAEERLIRFLGHSLEVLPRYIPE